MADGFVAARRGRPPDVLTCVARGPVRPSSAGRPRSNRHVVPGGPGVGRVRSAALAPSRAPRGVCVANSVLHRHTYVLDTSVLLSDPSAITRFDEHHVVLPIVVITELEAKRHHPELGFFARNALRTLDDLRLAHGRLDEPLAVGEDGGTVRVELNHNDPSVLPAGFRLGDNDTRILSVALSLSQEGH